MSTDPFGFCAEPECNDESPKDLPSFADMTRNLLNSAKDVVSGMVHGEGLLVTEDIYTTRMNICSGCEFFRKDDKRCTKCGCFMEAKTRLKKTYCPIQKWGTIDE